MNEIFLDDWSIVTDVLGGDNLRLHGRCFNHPTIQDGLYGFPSSFLKFDCESKIGTTCSGKSYKLGKFKSNSNAKSEKEALDLIQSWCPEEIF